MTCSEVSPPSNLCSCYLRLQETALNLFLLHALRFLLKDPLGLLWSLREEWSERAVPAQAFQQLWFLAHRATGFNQEPGTGRPQHTAGHTGPPKAPKTCWHGPVSDLACPEWLTRIAGLYFPLLQFGLNIVSCAVSAKFMQHSGHNNNLCMYGNKNTSGCASMISHVIAFRNVSTQFTTQHKNVLYSQHYHKGRYSLLRLVFPFRSTPVMTA